MNLTQAGADFLEHYGVRGMKWGVRKRRNESARAKTFGSKGKAKKPNPKDLTDDELRKALNRLNMERQFRSLTGQKTKVEVGADFAKSIAVNVARQQITNAVNAEIGKTLAKRSKS